MDATDKKDITKESGGAEPVEERSDKGTARQSEGVKAGSQPAAGNDSGGEEQGRSGYTGVKEPKYAIWVDMMTLVGVFIVANMVGGLIGSVAKRFVADPEVGTFVAYASAFALTIAFALWQRKWRGRGRKHPKVFEDKKGGDDVATTAIWVLWGFVLVIATSVVIEPLLDLFPSQNLEMLSKAIGTGGWAILTSVVAAPILEEVLFRGIVQRSLMERIGKWRGIFAAAAIFGIVHIIPQQMINAFFIGIILGFIYVRTRSIIPVILIHALNNALAFIQMSLGSGEYISLRGLVGNDTMYWIVYGVCGALLIFMVAVIAITQRWNAGSRNAEPNNGLYS